MFKGIVLLTVVEKSFDKKNRDGSEKISYFRGDMKNLDGVVIAKDIPVSKEVGVCENRKCEVVLGFRSDNKVFNGGTADEYAKIVYSPRIISVTDLK